MNDKQTAPALSPCATCPWRKQHHGKPHKAGWYNIGNLRRLWNGLRTGNAPGMVCHSTDPRAIEYGGAVAVNPGKERECAGAIMLINREIKLLETAPTYNEYRAGRKSPLTKQGLGVWINRIMFGEPITLNMEHEAEIALPFQQEIHQ